ncbi:MAG: DUF3343 domain-containing protein, partial [Candidatus Obscuribacterales bacterium]|nr:DUF3343 domain-containing protein [Candidatus Obscuribacterales bacterium]
LTLRNVFLGGRESVLHKDNKTVQMRIILTFSTLHQVLAAEKALRNNAATKTSVRPTPTPPGLGPAICGMSLEVLEKANQQAVLDCLSKGGLNPVGVFEV